MIMESMKSGHVVSDLHLFTHRSTADRRMGELRAIASEADFFVLNGDIFDFRWSTLADAEATAAAAEQWLEELAETFPRCLFLYIMGNHDALEPFARQLDDLARRRDNFRWHRSHVRVGNSLFLHGDRVVDGGRTDPLSRRLTGVGKPKTNGHHLAYRAIIATRAHRVVSALHSRRWWAKRILRSLETHHEGLADGLTDIYFGHIHKTFSDFDCGGVTFHNSGSTVRGLKCRMLAVRT